MSSLLQQIQNITVRDAGATGYMLDTSKVRFPQDDADGTSREYDKLGALIAESFQLDPLRKIELSSRCAVNRILQVHDQTGPTQCNMGEKIRRLAAMPWNPSDDTMIILHTREMLELHTNFTKAAEKAKHGPWTCVLWRFNVADGARDTLGGDQVYVDSTFTRWIVTKKFATMHCLQCLPDEAKELAHAFCSLLVYMGVDVRWVRYFGWGSPNPKPAEFPAKCLDDKTKPCRRYGFGEVTQDTLVPLLSKQELKVIDRVLAATPVSEQIVAGLRQKRGCSAEALRLRAFNAKGVRLARNCREVRASKCAWCAQTAQEANVPSLKKCGSCQVEHWKNSHKAMCKAGHTPAPK